MTRTSTNTIQRAYMLAKANREAIETQAVAIEGEYDRLTGRTARHPVPATA